MLDYSLLFKIGALGIFLVILDKVLEAAGKKDFAVITNLAGIVIVLMMVVSLVSKLFDTVKTMFTF